MHVFATSKILLVEDEKDLARIIVTWLSKDGYAVDSAFDGLEAWQKIYSSNYDLIVVDLMLPFIDGIEICRRTRAQGLTMPILMLTAHGSPAVRNAALKSGVDLFMSKPFKLGELSANLCRLLQYPKVSMPPKIVHWQRNMR